MPRPTSSCTDATVATTAPQILCTMRMPPNLDGHGGSQRAMRLLEALLPHGDVHFVLLHRRQDHDCVTTPLDAVRPLAASVTSVQIEGWQGSLSRRLGFIPGKLWDFVKMRSHEAPRLSRRQLRLVAERLPRRRFDLVFAGRLCTAVIVQSLLDAGLITADRRVVDFDDVMSKFRVRQVREDASLTRGRRLAARVDAAVIARAEARVSRAWGAVSVCTDDDAALLRASHGASAVFKVPNVVDRPRLPPRTPDGTFRLLFTGNLGFAPNIDGLRLFLANAWEPLRARVPGLALEVVGIHPADEVRRLCERHGLALHADVPSLEPHYATCDAVIAPILFGSGTRIKILEAMAYGRPVVSTPMGAEGMGLIDGTHLLLGETMDRFADAILRLAEDPRLRESLADAARTFQQAHYTPQAIHRAVSGMVRAAT